MDPTDGHRHLAAHTTALAPSRLKRAGAGCHTQGRSNQLVTDCTPTSVHRADAFRRTGAFACACNAERGMRRPLRRTRCLFMVWCGFRVCCAAFLRPLKKKKKGNATVQDTSGPKQRHVHCASSTTACGLRIVHARVHDAPGQLNRTAARSQQQPDLSSSLSSHSTFFKACICRGTWPAAAVGGPLCRTRECTCIAGSRRVRVGAVERHGETPNPNSYTPIPSSFSLWQI